jgi:rhodanese-related sulfurtransferase
VPDVREAGRFAKDHIPGAVNIAWRQVFAQRTKLPKDKTVLVYCNTCSFAAQVAAMSLGSAQTSNVAGWSAGTNTRMEAACRGWRLSADW